MIFVVGKKHLHARGREINSTEIQKPSTSVKFLRVYWCKVDKISLLR
jgi:hypothetical protein